MYVPIFNHTTPFFFYVVRSKPFDLYTVKNLVTRKNKQREYIL
jgi:hypothetical protein